MATLTETVRAFLDERRFAVVATLDPDATAHLSVVWYEIEGDDFVFSTATGNHKHRNLRRDPHLSVCVEDDYRYVTLRGTAIFEEAAAVVSAGIVRQAIRYLGPEQGPAMAATISASPHILVRMPIARVVAYGFEAQPG